MEGQIKVESKLQHGTTFRLYFPEARTAETVTAAPATSVPAGRRRGRETLLLVEDDDAVRVFLAEVLERHGYEVLAAEHQTAALALVEASTAPIHLVITDVVMPGGTGPELARALETMRPGVPVLYISGYADPVLAHEGTLPKATHFLQKPFLAGDLLTRIAQILMPSM
jgi:DNA-binding NtrC family response regulator